MVNVNKNINNLESEVKKNSLENAHSVDNTPIDTRRVKLLTNAFEYFFWNGLFYNGGLKKTTKVHVDIPAETKEVIQEHKTIYPGITAIMYAPLHKNFLETLLLPCVIKEFVGGEIPYAIMNTKRTGNTVKYILNKAGVYDLDRTSRDAGLKAMQITQAVLTSGSSFVYFPEGTRSIDGKVGKFGVAGFQAALNAAETTPLCIIPVDITSQYNDDVINGKKNSYGLSAVAQTFKKRYGNTYLSFGEPIYVLPVQKTGLNDKELGALYRSEREKLAQETRNACINLKVILNEHIHAEAIRRLEATEETIFSISDILGSIDTVVKDLEPHRHRFRGVDTSDIESIWLESMLPYDPTTNNAHIFYSNEIAPFLPRGG